MLWGQCDKALNEYESKLHLVERFLKMKGEIEEIKKLSLSEGDDTEKLKAISRIADTIIGEL